MFVSDSEFTMQSRNHECKGNFERLMQIGQAKAALNNFIVIEVIF